MEIRTGNIFTTDCQTVVNTVNCVGVMGAGIALECRLRYPDMFEKYRKHCDEGLIDIGRLWLYKGDERWILNFPTKRHWRRESKPSYLERGLEKFMSTYRSKGIESIAFSLLGASHGGLSPEQSLRIMRSYLDLCEIEVEIWRYDPSAVDDLYPHFSDLFSSHTEEQIAHSTGMRKDYVRKIQSALDQPEVNSISRLASVKGIGKKTLEKSFDFVMAQS